METRADEGRAEVRGGKLTQGEPRQDEGGDVVQELDVEEEHADDVVAASVHAAKVHEGVDASGEGAIEPATALRDELGRALGHVRLALGRLDVRQMPLGAGLGDELEAQDPVLGQEHVLLEDVHALDALLAQLLRERVVAVEVLLKRAAHDGAEAVGREGAGQDADVAEGALERLVQDVADLVLEVLGGDERVDQLLPALAQHGVDLAAGAAEVLVVVESLPEREQRLGPGLGAGVEQDDDLGVQDAAEGVEEPAMRVDLLAVLLLEAEEHLHRRQGVGAVGLRPDQLLVRGDGELGRVLEHVRDGLLAVDVALHDAVLVDADGGEHVEGVLVAGIDAVEDHGDDDLLPGRTALVPELGLLEVDNVPDVLHHAMQGPRRQHLVLVVVRDGDKELGVAVEHGRPQIVSVLQREVVRVAGGGRI